LARTDPDAARPQQGITALAVEMASEGVEVRPLVQMTGDAEFNEVFLTDVFVPEEQRIGVEGGGWTVAGSTLAHERGTSFPFKEQVVHETYLDRLYREAASNGALDDAVVADALARAYIDLGVLRLHNLRTLTRLGRGEEPGPESSWVKLQWTTMTQHLSEAGLEVVARGEASALAGPWARQWLWSRAASIAGGTSEVQRDIIAGRILQLPR
jgi:alkylation response protein AidB-like acyl-CoA dehydrogenase